MKKNNYNMFNHVMWRFSDIGRKFWNCGGFPKDGKKERVERP